MQISFIKSGFNSYGGTFNEPFRYFGRIISDRFKKEEIEFTFKEIEIILSVFSNKQKQKENEAYNEWYNKLPRYFRSKNKVIVTLPILETEKTLEDVFKSIYLAFEIIISKKKKDDIYDQDKIKQILSLLEAELNKTDLWELNKQ